MKNIRISSLLLFALMFVFVGFISCDYNDNNDVLPTNVVASLTEDEKIDLQFMREEEKLARDVYLNLYDKHGLNIFKNIASSEQSHMDAILVIMNKYGVEDPALLERGVFTNTDLQDLYDALIQQGETSLVAALTVGATIEDVDIRDLDEATAATSQADIIKMYDKLNCGSRNHMRAFTKKLNEQEEIYIPQFITQVQYESVINGGQEKCGK